MFSMRFWDSFGAHGVSCVKLPAAVAFPTDGRLLQRIEESRRALPANNMKPLWRSRELAGERVSFAQAGHGARIDHEAAAPAARREADSCVVPLARLGRVRDGINVSAA
jgi:hypothetical protein